MKNQTLATAGIVILLLIGGWWLYNTGTTAPAPENAETSGKTGESSNTGTSSPNPQSPTAPAAGESVSVADQPAGMSVIVSSVSLSQMGWVAVKDDRGWILGAGRLEMGTHQNISVPLLRTTESGQRYQALLYIDDGDKEFDLRKDSLVIESGGSVAGAMFSAQ